MKGCIMPVFEFLTTFTDWLCKITLEVSFCVLLILLFRRFLGRFLGARMCRLVWIILFIRCLVPWSFTVPYHAKSILPGISAVLESASGIVPSQSSESAGLPESSSGSVMVSQGTSIADSSSMSVDPKVVLAGLWAIGMFALLGLTIHRNWRMAQSAIANPAAVPSWVQEIFIECRDRLNIKAWPVLIITSGIASPSLMGAVRPRILLPRDMVDESDREQMRHILLHELAHLKQGDIWFSWLWTFLWALQWFNPLMWWAGRCVYLDREMACDERVLGLLKPENRNEYGYSLVELFKKLSLPVRYPSLAGIVEHKTHIERRLTMIKHYQAGSTRQLIIGILAIVMLLGLSLTSFVTAAQATLLTSDKAELMGRVEQFLLQNFRDVTARKSIEWEEVEIDKKGNSSIRYMYDALIWDKEWKIMNQVFTFDANGQYVNYKNVSGYPKAKVEAKTDTLTKEGMMALVEKFFSRNWRDITARKTIEWGEPATDEEGNRSIRYKCEATIWDKTKKIMNKVFTFTPEGEYVSVKDASASVSGSSQNTKIDSPKDTVSKRSAITPEDVGEQITVDLSTSEATVVSFTKAAATPKQKGIQRARQDIADAKMKILYYGKPWSQGKPLVDDKSGLPIEIVAGCKVTHDFVEEANTYNEVMRQEVKKRNSQPKDARAKK